MALDMKRMRQSHQENQRGGDIWNPPVGLTKVYIHPPCREDDKWEPTVGTNLITLGVHYGLGPNNGMGVCLEPERNPILQHPFLKKLLEEKKIKLPKMCPVERAISDGDLDSDDATRARLSTRYLFGVTPIMQKTNRTAEDWTALTPKPSVMLVGNTVYNGIMDEILENGDITDMNKAIFLIIGREGTKMMDTKYTVKADPTTVRKPMVLPAKLQSALNKALQPKGDCDLFKVVANMVKGSEELKLLMSGSKVSTGRGASRDDEDEDEEIEEEDDADDVEEDEDLEDADEEEAPPPKKTKAAVAPVKAKKAAVVEEVEEDEEEEDDEDELEEEDEPPPPPKKKTVAPPPAAKKKAAAPPPDEEDDDEDEELEELEESEEEDEPVKPAKKAKAPVDDDEDLGLDELDKELEAIEAAPKKKVGRPPKAK